MQNWLNEDSILNIPDLDPRYILIRKIGKGSYGNVYSAKDRVKNRLVAIKVIEELFDDLIDCK